MNKPRMYMLIGLPGSGKTTWAMANNMIGQIISSDAVIDAVAVAANKTYNSVFWDIIDPATKILQANIELTSYLNQPFILDQTNLTKKSRKSKMALLRNPYDVEAVYFDVALEDCIKRAKRDTKTIKEDIVKDMYNKLQPPELEEGFVSIRTVDAKGNLKSIKGA